MTTRYDLEKLQRDFNAWEGMPAWEKPSDKTPRDTIEANALRQHERALVDLRSQRQDQLAELFNRARALADHARGTELETDAQQAYEHIKWAQTALVALPEPPLSSMLKKKTFHSGNLPRG